MTGEITVNITDPSVSEEKLTGCAHLKCLRDPQRFGRIRVTVECEPTPSECAELSCKEKLRQANNAYHQLMTLQRPVSIANGNRNVRYGYNTNSISDLRKYIAELEAKCGEREIVSSGGCGCRTVSRPKRTRSGPGVINY